jgi:hypothetical protein
LLTPAWGYALAFVLILGLVLICWKIGRAPIDSENFALTIALVLAVTIVIIPMFAPYNQLLMLPGVLLILRHWRDLESTWRGRFGCAIAAVTIGWPWIASVGLALASIALPAPTVERAWMVPLYTSLFIPLAVLALLVLLAFGRVRRVELV